MREIITIKLVIRVSWSGGMAQLVAQNTFNV